MSNSDFFHKVYKIVKKVPFGRVTTYGAIAKAIGAPGASRMVGWAMNASHHMENVPAHRVVNRNGLLTGKAHFAHPDLMQQLLENEGIKIKNNQILNFDALFWDPNAMD